ncbi:peroxisome chaperone and import receptor [Tylopilus felleus]
MARPSYHAPSHTMSSANQRSRVDEEEDLDDLDDVLDQFSPPAQPTTTAPSQPPPSAGASTTSPPPAADPHSEESATVSDEFAAEFAKEMESLLNGLGIDPDAKSKGKGRDGGNSGGADRERLAAAWEAMLVEGMNTTVEPSNARASSSADASSPGTTGHDFQSSIRSTLNRLKESESGLQPSDASASAGGENLESLLAQLKDLGNVGEGANSEEHLQGVLEEMMGQLMGKDVLYEPLKELHEKFPGYLTEHASTISAADKARYETQIVCIKHLIDAFEAPSYRDDDDKMRGKIVELMSELQTHGSPPEEIMGPLPTGFSIGTDGLPEMPDGCNMN